MIVILQWILAASRHLSLFFMDLFIFQSYVMIRICVLCCWL